MAVFRAWAGLGLGVGLAGAAEEGGSAAWVEDSPAALASLFALASSFSLFCTSAPLASWVKEEDILLGK